MFILGEKKRGDICVMTSSWMVPDDFAPTRTDGLRPNWDASMKLNVFYRDTSLLTMAAS
jgi:hypothetical protein